jgi:hypothetical protein
MVFMMEPWNDKDFMDWAFGGEPISLCLDGYHKVLHKLYDSYGYMRKIEERFKMIRDLDKMKIDLTEEERNYLLELLYKVKSLTFIVAINESIPICENAMKQHDCIINKLSEKKCDIS